jgi:hypothetical protein
LGLRGKTTEFPTFSIPNASFAHIPAKSRFDTLSENPSSANSASPLDFEGTEAEGVEEAASRAFREGTASGFDALHVFLGRREKGGENKRSF